MLTRENILDYLRANKEYFRQNYGVIELGLFGSFAKNEATEKSDIDIIYDFEKGTIGLFDKKIEISEVLSKEFKRDVDLCRIKYVRSFLKPNILRDAIYV